MSAMGQSTSFNIARAKNLELGVTLPTVLVNAKTNRKSEGDPKSHGHELQHE